MNSITVCHPVVVLNNKGYTIERCVRAPERKYHDIMDWRWTALLQDLGDPELKLSSSFVVRTKQQLSRLLDDVEFAEATRIQLVEVIMDKYDAPDILRHMAEAVGRTSHN